MLLSTSYVKSEKLDVKMYKYLLILAVTLSTIATTANAQYSKRKVVPWILRGFSAEVKAGPNYFYGDIGEDKNIRFTGELTARKEISTILDVRTDIDAGLIGGEINRMFWPAQFHSLYFVWDAGVDYRFLNTGGYYFDERLFEPYVGAGIGVLLFNPENTSPYMERAMSIEEFDINKFTAAPMAYVDMGVRYFYDNNWGIRLEVKALCPFGNNSDKLDGHDSRLTNEDDGVLLGSYNYDMIGTIMVGVSYKFHSAGFRISSKYNRRTYLGNRRIYKRNAKRVKRR